MNTQHAKRCPPPVVAGTTWGPLGAEASGSAFGACRCTCMRSSPPAKPRIQPSPPRHQVQHLTHSPPEPSLRHYSWRPGEPCAALRDHGYLDGRLGPFQPLNTALAYYLQDLKAAACVAIASSCVSPPPPGSGCCPRQRPAGHLPRLSPRPAGG